MEKNNNNDIGFNAKYYIGYEYENEYGKFKIIDTERQKGRIIYIVQCQKCKHIMKKKSDEISKDRKCLGCVRNMEYSFYNVGDVVNGLKILKKVPTVDNRGYIKKEYLCECIVDGNIVQIRESHLKNGVGCMVCAGKKRGIEQRKSHSEYVAEMSIKNPFINIVGTYIDQYTKIKYICKICGYEGESLPNNLLRGGGCPECNMSNGEKKILRYLKDNNIQFKEQYTFKNCKNIFCLPFDFYLSEYNTCIEYDGEQHFKPIDYFGGEEGFISRQHNDNIKTQYCKNNRINLLRIRYDEDVEQKLNEYFDKIVTIQN